MGTMGRRLSYAGVVSALTAVYFLAGTLGLKLAFVHPSATTVWLPTGIALAALLVLGSRVWPGVLLGAFLVNVTASGAIGSSAGIALGNLAEALLGAFLVNRYCGGVRAFQRVPDVFRFALLAGMTATLVSAAVGVTSLCLGGHAPWSAWVSIALTWWLGNLGGNVIVAPLVILWLTGSATSWTRRHAIEAGLLLLALCLVGEAVFGPLLPIAERRYPLQFLAVPLLVWAAFRFGPRETATAAFVFGGIAIWGTLHGFGVFAREAPSESLLLLQAFLGVITIMALTLAAAVLEQRRAHERLQTLEREQAEQGRIHFIANAAHELRTPLTAMVGLAEIVGGFRQNLTVEQLEEYCQMIRHQGERARRLITGLLDLSRMEQGLLHLDLRPVALETVIRRATDAVPLPDGRSIGMEIADDSLCARADAARLEEVLVNLLRNACLYGGRQVTLSAFASGDQAVLAVSDDGEGVPEELIPHLFEPFTRGKAAARTEGSGLGLAIARGTVEAMGGSLGHEPGQPCGARFVIRLARSMDGEAG